MRFVRTLSSVWPALVPPTAVLLLAATWGNKSLTGLVLIVVAVFLAGAVLAAVHHAEIVAHRVGEPFGSLILAVAVTVIEVGLIVTIMTTGGDDASSIARDTVFAAVMITMNGIVGISLLAATLRGGHVSYSAQGTGAAVAVIASLATLSLVLPAFTTSTPGPTYSGPQLAFAAAASLALYLLFVFVQSTRNRELYVGMVVDLDATGDPHDVRPTSAAAWQSLGLLVIALVAVIGLAKVESPAIEEAVRTFSLPPSLVGVVIALLVLMPESLAAFRAAVRDHIQTSLNLAYGSAMASIGLTIPVVAIAQIWMTTPLTLGLSSKDLLLLSITVIVSVLTVTPGRATLLQAGVHLTLFGTFLVLAVTP